MCTHPFAKEALTLHLVRSKGHERYFDCNLMHRKVLASSDQHLMAEAPANLTQLEFMEGTSSLISRSSSLWKGQRRTTKEARDVEARYSWDSESDGKAALVGVGGACGGVNQLLTFYEFPRAMWKSIRTTNALENLKPRVSTPDENPSVVLQRGVRGRFAVWAYRLWPDSTTTHRRLPTSERGSRTRGSCRLI